MKITILLADAAQAVGGKLYVLGGGWSITGPGAVSCALASKIEVPWEEANRRHRLQLRLLDSDERPVRLATAEGERAVEIDLEFEAGRPAGLAPGTPLDVTTVVNINQLSLPPGGRFFWRCAIDGRPAADWGHTADDWQIAFSTRPAPQAGPAH